MKWLLISRVLDGNSGYYKEGASWERYPACGGRSGSSASDGGSEYFLISPSICRRLSMYHFITSVQTCDQVHVCRCCCCRGLVGARASEQAIVGIARSHCSAKKACSYRLGNAVDVGGQLVSKTSIRVQNVGHQGTVTNGGPMLKGDRLP